MIFQAFASTTQTLSQAEHGSIFQDPTFWTSISFILTISVLLKLFYKKGGDFLQARGDEIAQKIEEAHSLKSDARKLLETFSKDKNALDEETQEELNKAKNEAETYKQTLIKTYEEKIFHQEKETKRVFEKSTEQLLQELETLALDVSITSVERILIKKYADELGQTYLRETIDTLPELFSNRPMA